MSDAVGWRWAEWTSGFVGNIGHRADTAAAARAAAAGHRSVDSVEFDDGVESLGRDRRTCDRRGLVDDNKSRTQRTRAD